jgi:hypothetical protein
LGRCKRAEAVALEKDRRTEEIETGEGGKTIFTEWWGVKWNMARQDRHASSDDWRLGSIHGVDVLVDPTLFLRFELCESSEGIISCVGGRHLRIE